MGKSKKKKSGDFQKVKLKVGKKKPVGQNVTNTEFRTSTIQIASQLEEKIEPTNKRNLSLKDLLCQLNHYNVTVRHEALVGMKDLFIKHPNVMHNDVNFWLSKVLDKVTDTDPAVRHSLLLCMSYAFNLMPENEVRPFTKILLAYICSGMTHINEGVQIDSLNILEIVICKYPNVFLPHTHKILNNFMHLLVKQTSKETSNSQTLKGSKIKVNSTSSKKDFSLSGEGKLTSLKTRTKILHKLYSILKVFNDRKSENENESDGNLSSEIIIDKKIETFIQIYKYSINPRDVIKTKSVEDLMSNVVKNKIFITDNFDDFSDTLFKVLISIWVEYEPGQLASALIDSNSLRNVIPGMKVIIDVIDILMALIMKGCDESNRIFHLTEKSWYRDFNTHFLRYFILPINFAKSTTKSINLENANDMQQFAISFNFVSARILVHVLQTKEESLKIDDKTFNYYMKKVKEFLDQSLDSASMLNEEQIDELIKIVNIMIDIRVNAASVPAKFQGNLVDVPFILKKLTYIFTRASITSPWKMPLINFFAKFISEFKVNNALQDQTWDEVGNFINNLVSIVWSVPSTSTFLLKTSMLFIKQVIVQQFANKKMEALIESTLIKMTDPEKGLFVHLVDETQRLVVEVVYNLNHISDQLIKNITFVCHQQKVSQRVKKYIISILHYGLNKPNPILSNESFINVVLSIILGYNVNEMKNLNSNYSNTVSWSMLNVYPDQLKDIPFEYAIDQLRLLDGHQKLWSIMVPIIGKFLVMFRCLPVTPAVGLVKLLERLSQWSMEEKEEITSVESEINQVADLISSLLLYSVSETYQSISKTPVDMKITHKHDEQLEDDVISSCINLLSQNDLLLRQLLKKWINILGEYKMDWTCVSSICEVIIALLYDTNLQLKMAVFKPNLMSITNAFSNMNLPVKEQNLMSQLVVQISML